MQDKFISKEHLLKIDEIYFSRLADGSKKCELRFNDRDYQVGDLIRFEIVQEDDHREFVEELFKITHVLNYPKGLMHGWVVLSLELKKSIYD